MKNKILTILAFFGFLGVAFVTYYGGAIVYDYTRARFFPSEDIKRVYKKLQSIIIRNDIADEVFVEFTRDGQLVAQKNRGPDEQIGDTQGKVRVFVPEKKGWYTIEYPYPYPLTEQTSWIYHGPRWVSVNLSSLINSVSSGEVEYDRGLIQDMLASEKGVAKDIKVTFEPGEVPREMLNK